MNYSRSERREERWYKRLLVITLIALIFSTFNLGYGLAQLSNRTCEHTEALIPHEATNAVRPSIEATVSEAEFVEPSAQVKPKPKVEVEPVKPKPKVEVEGSKKSDTYKITFYCPCAKCCGKTDGITASGTKATAKRTVAAPKTFAFGEQIRIDGLGHYVVEDRGGSIKGNRIDVFVNSHAEALKLGVKYAKVERVKD